MSYKYLFGPVPSRRLGISLGIDLIPYKVCSMDCVYCECGHTTELTVERKEYVPTNKVLEELGDFLVKHQLPDFITFSGSGEPTLHSDIGLIIEHIKKVSKAPIALLTNASLMVDAELRREIMGVDVVLPSLDAADNETMRIINRPHHSVSAEKIVAGLEAFREEFKGEIWLEVFLVDPINTSKKAIEMLDSAVSRIDPDKVQLNSLDRPGSERWVKKVSPDRLQKIAEMFHHPQVEIISRYRNRREILSYRNDVESAILETIARRPCTLDDLSEILGLHRNELNKYLDVLEGEKRVKAEIQERGIFYRRVFA